MSTWGSELTSLIINYIQNRTAKGPVKVANKF